MPQDERELEVSCSGLAVHVKFRDYSKEPFEKADFLLEPSDARKLAQMLENAASATSRNPYRAEINPV